MFKRIIKEFLPPFLIRQITGLFYGWHGNYATWELASKKCSGYDADEVLSKVLESSLKVKEGKFPYERDSVLFSEVQYSYPVLSSLILIANKSQGQLKVLDFGGSLGSSYYQNKLILDTCKDVRWCVVEQTNFVEVGKERFQNDSLKFYYSIDECLSENSINVVLLSSVLPYIDKPYDLLEKIMAKKIDYILFDRMPFIDGKDRITIQKVNPSIYKASYPCWFFNKSKFIEFMKSDYEIIFDFESLGRANIVSEFRGFLFRKK